MTRSDRSADPARAPVPGGRGGRSRHPVPLTVLALAGAAALLISAAPAAAHGHEWEALHLHRAPPGIRAPDFTLLDLDGRPQRLADFRGRPVLVNFWASWCAPCEMEMPAMQRLQERAGTAGVVVLGVNFKEPATRVRAFTRERGLGFVVLLDPVGKVFSQYEVETLPFTVLVDTRGEVRAVAEGPRDWSSVEARALLERLAGGKKD